MNYAVFILSHGRAESVKTYDTLINKGYSGKIYIVIDDMDAQEERYKQIFGEKSVIVFDKKEQLQNVDYMMNNGKLNSVVYARNKVYDIAENEGYQRFVVMDDDITHLHFRYVEENSLKSMAVTNLDQVFNRMIKYATEIDAMALSVGMENDYIGGVNGPFKRGYYRRAFGFYVLDTEKRMRFKGLANEDLNASLVHGSCGGIILSLLKIQLGSDSDNPNQVGGMKDFYQEKSNKYEQHFFTIMAMPSCNRITFRKDKMRVTTKWRNAIPCILNDDWKKGVQRVGDSVAES